MIETLSLREKIHIALLRRKKTRKWLSDQLGMHERNLYWRFNNDNWTEEELQKLKELGIE